MDAAAPLLCAGITTYSPLMHYSLNKAGMKIGVVGLGGLGHMAVKIGKAMGLEVSECSNSRWIASCLACWSLAYTHIVLVLHIKLVCSSVQQFFVLAQTPCIFYYMQCCFSLIDMSSCEGGNHGIFNVNFCVQPIASSAHTASPPITSSLCR